MLFEIECDKSNSNIDILKSYRFYLVPELSAGSKLVYRKNVNKYGEMIDKCFIGEKGHALTRQNISATKFQKLMKFELKHKCPYLSGFVLTRSSIDLLGTLVKTGAISFRFFEEIEEAQEVLVDFNSVSTGDFILEYGKLYKVI